MSEKRVNWLAPLGAILALGLGNSAEVAAQSVIPDDTLGAESSRVHGVNGNRDRVDGGALRGANLFHSFREFGIREGHEVYFANPDGVNNIFSRVTGANASHLLGTLGVLGEANFYLINPQGIIFGENASLDIRGSFVGSTASAVLFPDGSQFSAINPEMPPLLVNNVPIEIELQFAGETAAIVNLGRLEVGEDLTLVGGSLDLQGQVIAGKDLYLQGQETVTIRDSESAPFVAVAGGELEVRGDDAIDIFALNHLESGLFSGGDMVLKSNNTVIGDAHYYSGGSFAIEQLDGSLGGLESPNDPIIRSLGDVSFDSYAGASLHILAGGKVEIPGLIWITGADSVNGLIETVTLSDGSTVEIDGKNQPILDIRAGMKPNAISGSSNLGGIFLPSSPRLTSIPTSANINIGSIAFRTFSLAASLALLSDDLSGFLANSSELKGNISLTNQYQPNSSLQGGDINITDTVAGIGMITNGGHIDINSRSTINLDSILDTSSSSKGGNIAFTSQDNINISGLMNTASMLDGGNISLTSKNGNILATNIIFNTGASKKLRNSQTNTRIPLFANIITLPDNNGTGGDISFSANNEINFNTVILNNSGGDNGSAGQVTLQSNGDILLQNTIIEQETEQGRGKGFNLQAQSFSLNNSSIDIRANRNFSAISGDIKIETSELTRINQSILGTSNRSGQPNGDLEITTGYFEVRDSIVSTSTDAIWITGEGGTLTVNADTVELSGTVPNNISINSSDGIPSNLSSISLGVAPAGEIRINTEYLIVRDGGAIAALTGNPVETSRAGSIVIKASESILVSGTSTSPLGEITGIFVDTLTPEAAGDLTLETKTLIVENGANLSASTLGTGDGGSIFITADRVHIRDNGGISAGSFGLGNGGNVEFIVSKLIVENSSTISTSNEPFTVENQRIIETINNIRKANNQTSSIPGQGLPTGNAGNINLSGNIIILKNNGEIITRASSGEGGNISLHVRDLILLRHGSTISATAGTAQAGGNGGNIDINMPDGFIVGVPRENSDITANAFTGNGGNINITAQGIFGLKFRDRLTTNSDITASSEFGLDGSVNINTLGIDPVSGLSNLPEQPVEPKVQLGCSSGNGADASSLHDIGQGGLPASPNDMLSGEIDEGLIPLETDAIAADEPLDELSRGDEDKSPTTHLTSPCAAIAP